MISGRQIERARELLGWDRTLLARRAGNLVTVNAIRKAELGDVTALNREQLSALERAFIRAGIKFTAAGVPFLNDGSVLRLGRVLH